MLTSINSTILTIALVLFSSIALVACGVGSNHYNLDIVVEPTGAASLSLSPEPDKNGKYLENTLVTISVTLSPGYRIGTWQGQVSDRNAPTTTITMNSDHEIQLQLATVDKPTEQSMTTDTEFNNINDPPTYNEETNLVILDEVIVSTEASSTQAPVSATKSELPITIANPESSTPSPSVEAIPELPSAVTVEIPDDSQAISGSSNNSVPVPVKSTPALPISPIEQIITPIQTIENPVATTKPETGSEPVTELPDSDPIVETIEEYSITIGGIPVSGTTLELETSTISISPGPNGTDGKYIKGTPVQLAVTPKTGNILSAFSNQACTSIPTCTLTLDMDITVDIIFLKTYSLSINATQVAGSPVLLLSGRIDISPPNAPDSRYHSGTVVTLIPRPDLGFQFAGWDGACVGIGRCSILMNESWDGLTASFKSASLPDWSAHTLSLSSQLIKSDGDTIITTIFTQDNASPTVTTVSFSLINPATETEVKQGSPCGSTVSGEVTNRCWNAAFSIPANPGTSNQIYRLVVSSPSMPNSPESQITVEGTTYSLNINGPIVTTNTLSLNGGTFILSEVPNGMNNKFLSGTQVIVTPVSDEGFLFLGWIGDCSGTGSCVVIMSQDRSITGTFASL